MNIYFVTLGCDKNLVDSEKMLGILSQRGYNFTEDLEAADIAVVNTCCFIKDAQKESVGSILDLADRKKDGKLKALIVTGCLAQRYREDILKEVPEVDAVLGTTSLPEIADVVTEILEKDGKTGKSSPGSAPSPAAAKAAGTSDGTAGIVSLTPLSRPVHGGEKRVLSTGTCTEYLKIAEGCSKRCTYCVIPDVRGPYRSVPMDELLEEAGTLASQGVKELILVAQETTLYGIDLYGKKMLPELLRKLCRIDGYRWIRILYCYPEEITDELIDVMASEPKILHYIDMPIQHASDDILRKMGRKTNRKELEERIAAIRAKIPDVCLRTTLISGFPTETETDHRHLLAFVRKEKFDRLGDFTYSKEDGTPAAKMKPQVKASEKKRRRAEIMEAQQKIAFAKARRMKGRNLTALIEGRLTEEAMDSSDFDGRNVYVARTYMDAPEVDGMLFLPSDYELMSGDFVNVKITGSRGYDLIGEVTGRA